MRKDAPAVSRSEERSVHPSLAGSMKTVRLPAVSFVIHMKTADQKMSAAIKPVPPSDLLLCKRLIDKLISIFSQTLAH